MWKNEGTTGRAVLVSWQWKGKWKSLLIYYIYQSSTWGAEQWHWANFWSGKREATFSSKQEIDSPPTIQSMKSFKQTVGTPRACVWTHPGKVPLSATRDERSRSFQPAQSFQEATYCRFLEALPQTELWTWVKYTGSWELGILCSTLTHAFSAVFLNWAFDTPSVF